MKNPKVSIIIATFNSDKTIERALNSVLNQKFQDWECIVVDGASKDNTIDIVKKISEKDSRFRYKSEPDTGIYNAFNKGWRLAKGTWVYYLGSDDELLPEGLDELFKQAKNETNDDFIYGNIQYRKYDGSIVVHRHFTHKNLPWKTFASHQGLITRRSLIEEYGGYDEKLRILADKDLIIGTFMQGGIVYEPTEATLAIFSAGGTSSNYYNAFKEDLYIWRKNHSGLKHFLYIIQHYPRMWMRKIIQK